VSNKQQQGEQTNDDLLRIEEHPYHRKWPIVDLAYCIKSGSHISVSVPSTMRRKSNVRQMGGMVRVDLPVEYKVI
jgi:hypothetical protein